MFWGLVTKRQLKRPEGLHFFVLTSLKSTNSDYECIKLATKPKQTSLDVSELTRNNLKDYRELYGMQWDGM